MEKKKIMNLSCALKLTESSMTIRANRQIALHCKKLCVKKERKMYRLRSQTRTLLNGHLFFGAIFLVFMIVFFIYLLYVCECNQLFAELNFI